MIYLKSSDEIKKIRAAGAVIIEIFEKLNSLVAPGINTLQLDLLAYKIINARNASPSFLNYGTPPFPASICTSINAEVVHGIPSAKRVLKDGDIVSIDVGVHLEGFHADAARTFLVGDVRPDIRQLVQVARECFFKGFDQYKTENRISDVSSAVEQHALKFGYGVVKELTGHGIGASLHEEPDVPNFYTGQRGARIREGMVIAIEPMINLGSEKVYIDDDEWTIVARDHKPSAHYENTVAIGSDGPIILTED